eukprot:5926180-Amphidinium_carterae.1
MQAAPTHARSRKEVLQTRLHSTNRASEGSLEAIRTELDQNQQQRLSKSGAQLAGATPEVQVEDKKSLAMHHTCDMAKAQRLLDQLTKLVSTATSHIMIHMLQLKMKKKDCWEGQKVEAYGCLQFLHCAELLLQVAPQLMQRCGDCCLKNRLSSPLVHSN